MYHSDLKQHDTIVWTTQKYPQKGYVQIINKTLVYTHESENTYIHQRLNEYDEYIRVGVKKPILYLYAPKGAKRKIRVNLQLPHGLKLLELYPYAPSYKTTIGQSVVWDVFAHHDGKIEYQNRMYPYLFWEAKAFSFQKYFSFSNESIILKKEQVLDFLEYKLSYYQFNFKEKTDFITFWLPLLKTHQTIKIEFLTQKYQSHFPIRGLPENSIQIRVYMIFQKTDETPTYLLFPKNIDFMTRDSSQYYLIEWGGSEIPKEYN